MHLSGTLMATEIASHWSFHNPVRIHEGVGLLGSLPEFLPSQGRLLFVTSPGFIKRGVAASISSALGEERICICADITPNPDLEDLDHLIAKLRGDPFTAILALGGGSVLDAAKVLSVLLPAPSALNLGAILRNGEPFIERESIPVFAIPTTSGTGAEVTPFATVWDRKLRKKHSLASAGMFPAAAVLDASLTLTLPGDETLYTGLDAISHCLESLWNKNRSPLSESYASGGLGMALKALPDVVRDPLNLDARRRMQLAALFAGLAISQTRTAIAHSISYPLTIHFNVPHGLACSFSLPNIIRSFVKQRPSSPHVRLMKRSLCSLEIMDLGSLLARYVDREQIYRLEPEMITAERANNFDAEVKSISDLLSF